MSPGAGAAVAADVRPVAGALRRRLSFRAVFGLTVRELTTDVRMALNLSEDVQGVIVRRVKSGSAAAIGGIRPGFVILALGGRPSPNLQAFTTAIDAEKKAKNSEVTFFCRIGGNTAFFRLQPRW